MSSKNLGENPKHRKPKVSWATQIDPGLGGPKPRLKGVGDGWAGQYSCPTFNYWWGDARMDFERFYDLDVDGQRCDS